MSEPASSTGNELVLHNCELCDYKTPKTAYLRKHQRKFHGSMPAKELNWRKCQRCHAEFATRTEFAGHKGCRIPCRSPGCAYQAALTGTLKRHVSRVHIRTPTSRKPPLAAEKEAPENGKVRVGKEAALRRLLQLRPQTAQDVVVDTKGTF